jgi:hypothetical protein
MELKVVKMRIYIVIDNVGSVQCFCLGSNQPDGRDYFEVCTQQAIRLAHLGLGKLSSPGSVRRLPLHS